MCLCSFGKKDEGRNTHVQVALKSGFNARLQQTCDSRKRLDSLPIAHEGKRTEPQEMGDTDRETGAADLHREFGVVVVMGGGRVEGLWL